MPTAPISSPMTTSLNMLDGRRTEGLIREEGRKSDHTNALILLYAVAFYGDYFRDLDIRSCVQLFLRAYGYPYVKTGNGKVFKRDAKGSYSKIGVAGLRWDLMQHNRNPLNREHFESHEGWAETYFALVGSTVDAILCNIPTVPIEFIRGAPHPMPKKFIKMFNAAVYHADRDTAQEGIGEAMLRRVTKPPMFILGPYAPTAEFIVTTARLVAADWLDDAPTTLAQFQKESCRMQVAYFDGTEADKDAWLSGEGFEHGVYTKKMTQTKFFVRVNTVKTLDAVSPELAKRSDVVHANQLPMEMTPSDLRKHWAEEKWSILGWALEGLVRLQMRDGGVQNLMISEPNYDFSSVSLFLEERYGFTKESNIIMWVPGNLFEEDLRGWRRVNDKATTYEVPMHELWMLGWDQCEKDGQKVYTNDPKLVDVHALKLKSEGASKKRLRACPASAGHTFI